MNHYIGIDLGGPNLRAAIADNVTGQIYHQRKLPALAAEHQEAGIGRIVQLVRELIEVSGVDCDIKGIGVPGTPSLDTGVIRVLPNLPGQRLNVPFQAIVEDQAQLPVGLINDVRAITLGEWMSGARRGAQVISS